MQRIKQIASNIRKIIEKERKIKDTKFCNKEYVHSLCGYCAIASVMLFKELEKNNIYCKLAVCENSDYDHVFIIIDNIVVDITATQFGEYKRVEIEDISNNNNTKDFWGISKIFDNPKELIEYQTKSGWDKAQIATIL